MHVRNTASIFVSRFLYKCVVVVFDKNVTSEVLLFYKRGRNCTKFSERKGIRRVHLQATQRGQIRFSFRFYLWYGNGAFFNVLVFSKQKRYISSTELVFNSLTLNGVLRAKKKTQRNMIFNQKGQHVHYFERYNLPDPAHAKKQKSSHIPILVIKIEGTLNA